jgi:ABC-type uncharacterized transport system substrate-binding protein
VPATIGPTSPFVGPFGTVWGEHEFYRHLETADHQCCRRCAGHCGIAARRRERRFRKAKAPPLIWSTQSLARALVAVAALSIWISPATAHPHVWVTAASELIYGPDGSVTGIRHAWTFDDMFSTYALQGIVTKKKGVYTREELAPLAQTNVDSLKEYGFFTFAKVEGKKQQFLDPTDYFLEHRDAALVLHFTLPFKAPIKTKQLAVEIFDPTYFVDFTLQKQNPFRLVGAPASCTMAIQRPDDGAAGAKKLGEAAFLNGSNSNYGAMFANKITVDCP